MFFLYQVCIELFNILLKLSALFSRRVGLFVRGRRQLFEHLRKKRVLITKPVAWVHVASLGEFEQGFPVIECLKNQGFAVAVSFFSPSGYEVKKNSDQLDLVTYLPVDTLKNARTFVEILQPSVAVFVKYDFWYNHLKELDNRSIPAFLVSGAFRESQIFFKGYGCFFRRILHLFQRLFVQTEQDKRLLYSIDIKNVSVSGDTRFDRVLQILTRDNSLDFMENFTSNASDCFVFGSSWTEDEKVYLPYIQEYKGDMKFVIAPHSMDASKILAIKNTLKDYKNTQLFSEITACNLKDCQVLIIDTVGLLTKIYSYATLAYVGGGMGSTGLHNVLEPAVFGIPVIIGKNYEKFKEATDLVQRRGIISISDETEFRNTMLKLTPEEKVRMGQVNKAYIKQNSGATSLFIKCLNEKGLLPVALP